MGKESVRRAPLLWLLALGCTDQSGSLEGLRPPNAAAPDAGDETAPDGGVVSGGCDGLEDLAKDNLRGVLRLGFALAETVLQAEVFPPAGDRRLAEAVIRSVSRGHAFLEGQRVVVALDALTTRRGDFPRPLLIGLTEPALPTTRDTGPPELSRVLITAELEERPLVEDLLGYRARPTRWVAGVEFRGVVGGRVEAAVVERIAGELPDRLLFNWGRPYALEAPTGRHIVTFGYPPSRLPDGTHLASPVDVRPYTEASRREVQEALRDATPPVNGAALAEARARYDASWRFHRAPRVVATEVTGLAGECCTGAGGTYVEHTVQVDLRGNADEARFVRGGHAYYSDEECGDARLLALDPLVASAGPEAFDCALSTRSLETGRPAPRVHAERADSPEARAEVQAWLQAPEPHYRLAGAEAREVTAPSEGPWSVPRTVPEALAFGQLVRIRVVDLPEREDGATEVVLETPFAPERYDHLEVREVRLAFTCGDPRLQQVGAEWWAPLFGRVDPLLEDGGASEGGLFLVPGVLFEVDGPAERLRHQLSRLLTSEP